ncbi:MAG: T9SS type A sorting domain-containing protein [Salibacteraceae bacterium]
MKKVILGAGALLALGIDWIAFQSTSQIEQATLPNTSSSNPGGWLPGETKTDPGWFQQWFDQRKNEQGVIPRGLYAQWAQHDAQYSGSRSSALSSILEVGPYEVGGRTRALLIDASNSNRYFAGGISGGLWRSNNAGVSWTPLNDQASNLAVSCIVQDPFNSNVIYYGTGEGSGNSAGFAGEGVIKSTEGGNSFSLLSSTNTGDFDYCWSIAHSRTQANTVFVGTSTRGLWRSTDGGSNWTKVLTTTRRINDMIALPNGTMMATLNGDGIYQSTDNGNSWTEIAGGLPTSGFARIAIDFCENSPNDIYALYAESNDVIKDLYRSTDGGATWTVTAAKPATTLKFTWYCFFLGVSPTNPDHVVLGAQYSRYSLDGGASWSVLSTGHADNHTYAYDPNNTDLFLIGNDGGVYRKSWSSISSAEVDLNDGYHVTQFYSGDYMPTGNSVLGGTQDNGTHKAIGLTWNKVFGGDGGYSQVSLQDPNLGYCSTQNGRIRRVTNLQGSHSVTSIYTTITNADNTAFIEPFEINRADGEQVYFCSSTRIWRTTDRGANWTAMTNAHGTIYGVGVTRDVNPTVYFGGSSAKIYRVDNAQTAVAGDEVDLSATVPSAVTNHSISDIKPHPTNNTVAYVTFSSISTQPRVWRVDNIHTTSPTWVAISGNLPTNLPCNSMEIDPTNDQNIFVGTDYGLYCSTDGGATYAKETSIPNTAVFQVQLRVSDNKLFVFTHGRGAWCANVGSGSGSPTYASVPYSTSFEGGFDASWTSGSDNTNGRVQITTANTPRTGSEHLTMDVVTSGTFATNYADLYINMSTTANADLRFWWKEFGDETHTQDGVFFSDDGGANFTKVANLQDGNNTYAEQVLDIDALASANGLSLTSTFVIRLQQYDNYPLTTDGFAFDDLSVTESFPYATLPYTTSFEGGLDQFWTTASDNSNGRIQVTSANTPRTGSQHLTMDVTTSGTYATNSADLRLNLSGQTDVDLSFWWKEFGDETNTEDGVFFSDDGGVNFVKVANLQNGNSTYAEQVLDVDALASANGLSLSNTFVIRLQQYDNYPIPTDGFAFDDIAVTSGAVYAPVPYSTSFESGFDQYWSTGSDNSNGRVQITTANTPRTGTNHFTMDVITNGTFATNNADLRVDLSGEIGVNLRFWWKEFGDETHTQDGVYFSDNGGATFVKVYDLANGNSTYAEQLLDVVALASANGLSMTGNFVIRFQQYDNYAISTDGFAIDDVNVEITANPNPGPLPSLIETEESGVADAEATSDKAWTVSAFPNPASDVITVQLDGKLTATQATLRVLDLSGREVLRQNNLVLATGFRNTLEVGHLPAGLYFVVLENELRTEVLRVMKQ